jgi:hypothetical protein
VDEEDDELDDDSLRFRAFFGFSFGADGGSCGDCIGPCTDLGKFLRFEGTLAGDKPPSDSECKELGDGAWW